jgi:hypothetical protein
VTGTHRRRRPGYEDYKSFPSRRPNRCTRCGASLPIGDPVLGKPLDATTWDIVCLNCGTVSANKRPPAPKSSPRSPATPRGRRQRPQPTPGSGSDIRPPSDAASPVQWPALINWSPASTRSPSGDGRSSRAATGPSTGSTSAGRATAGTSAAWTACTSASGRLSRSRHLPTLARRAAGGRKRSATASASGIWAASRSTTTMSAVLDSSSIVWATASANASARVPAGRSTAVSHTLDGRSLSRLRSGTSVGWWAMAGPPPRGLFVAEGGGGVEGGGLVGGAEPGEDADQGGDGEGERGRRVGDNGALVGKVG